MITRIKRQAAFFGQKMLLCPSTLSVLLLIFVGETRSQWVGPIPTKYLVIPSCKCDNVTVPPLYAYLFRPITHEDQVPLVVCLHGHTGLWTPDINDPTKRRFNESMQLNFREWASILPNNGIAAIFIDSFTSRNMTVAPDGGRPSYDPAKNDAVFSSTRVRPCDPYCVLKWVRQQQWVLQSSVGLMGWSQGGESGLGATMSTTVTRSEWWVYNQTSENTFRYALVTRPPRLAFPSEGFNVSILYYPGCRLYCYYGVRSCNDVSANNFMPQWPTLMMHGTLDSLWGINGINPQLVLQKSLAHSQYIGQTLEEFNRTNPLSLVSFVGAGHSFDLATPSWSEADQLAKSHARILSLQWLQRYLINPQSPIFTQN